MTAKRASTPGGSPRRPPAMTPEGRQLQLTDLAYDLAEQQLIDGTASAMVITHFLKAGTVKDQLEIEKLRLEGKLASSRADQIDSGARMEELYSNAIAAMRDYRGDDVPDDYSEELH